MCTRSDRFLIGRVHGYQILNLRLLYGKSIIVGGIPEAPPSVKLPPRNSYKALIPLSAHNPLGFYPERGWEERRGTERRQRLPGGHPHIL